MKNKSGFIFIETLVVLSILMIALISLYSTYVYIINDAKGKIYYENMGDVYTVRIIRSMMSVTASSGTVTTVYNVNANSGNCQTTYFPVNKIDTNICTARMRDEFKVQNVYVLGEGEASSNKIINDNTNTYPNSLKEYVKTLNKSKKLIVVYFKRGEDNYYASLEF